MVADEYARRAMAAQPSAQEAAVAAEHIAKAIRKLTALRTERERCAEVAELVGLYRALVMSMESIAERSEAVLNAARQTLERLEAEIDDDANEAG